jgi:hypothetical protein
MWRVLLSLLILFSIGRATLFFLNQFEPKEKLSFIEVAIYSFSLGYAILTIIGVTLAQFGLITPSINILTIIILPVLTICFWIYRKKVENPQPSQDLICEDLARKDSSTSMNANSFFSSKWVSGIILLLIFAVGLGLRLETQLSVPWLGDQDPYYHLSFIDSIIAQGTLPSQTFWGSYSYPPSFHVVFATLISTVQVDRYLLMKIVPEFLGFLCVPAVYTIIKRKCGEWPGIASAAFLAICSFHIYRTNIPIPEPIALLGMLMFFYAMTKQTSIKKYLSAGLFASIVFLTNVIAILYFLPGVVAIFVVSIILRRWNDALEYLKATSIGLLFSGIFWLPTLQKLGLNGIFKGLGPSYPYAGVFFFTSQTYFSWIGWGACILAIIGLYVCLRDFKNNLVFLIPTVFILFLIEAAHNDYFLVDAAILFRGLLFLGTWVSLLAGIGFWLLMRTKRKNIAATTLAILVALTAFSFPVLSGTRYPVNWGYDDVDFAYQSYRENYANIFEEKDHMIYSADFTLNYGAFDNVIWYKEAPQIRDALFRNDTSTSIELINEHQIRYLIFHNGAQEVQFLVHSDLAYIYYEDWNTIVLATK